MFHSATALPSGAPQQTRFSRDVERAAHHIHLPEAPDEAVIVEQGVGQVRDRAERQDHESGMPLGEQLDELDGTRIGRLPRRGWEVESGALVDVLAPGVRERVRPGERRLSAAGDREVARVQGVEQSQHDVDAAGAMCLAGARDGDSHDIDLRRGQ
jgi:hypothetical protein